MFDIYCNVKIGSKLIFLKVNEAAKNPPVLFGCLSGKIFGGSCALVCSNIMAKIVGLIFV